MRTHLMITLSVLALSFGGIAACADVADDVDEAELEQGTDDAKTDRADIPLTMIAFDSPLAADDVKVGLIKSKTAWKQVFGVSAPSSINFTTSWVAYYTAGEQTSGGYTATITRVRLSDTGKTLKISTRLDRPGPDCLNAQALTYPYAIVKFKKPSAPVPTTNRYYLETNVVACGQSCANGTIETEATYAPTGNGNEECLVADEHCITNDSWSCPQITPLPPSFCPNGTVQTVRRYQSSADGMECSLPSAHCVTNDISACPQRSPLPPNWCANGTVKTEPNFVSSADGMECYLPSVHCVIDDASVCPQ